MTTPTIQALYLATIADLENELSIIIPADDKNFLRVQAAVQAARLKLLYLNQAKLHKNIFPDLAEYESQGGTLERFGRIKLDRSPFPALSGQYVVQFSGTLGSVVPARTLFDSDDDSLNPGFRFVIDSSYTLAGFLIATIRALTPGIESKLEVGNTLTITSPIALVDSTVTVFSEAIPPQAAEDLEEYREKVLEAFQLEPQGGAGSDYRLWAGEAQGVAESYPFTVQVSDNIEVNLYVEATIADSSDGFGTPTAAILLAVQAAVEDPTALRPSRKPLTDVVNYVAVTPLLVEVEIVNLLNSTTAIQNAINESVKDLVDSVRPFVGSIDILSAKNDIISQFNLVGAILNAAPGSVFDAANLKVATIVVSTYTFTGGEIPYIVNVTFV